MKNILKCELGIYHKKIMAAINVGEKIEVGIWATQFDIKYYKILKD